MLMVKFRLLRVASVVPVRPGRMETVAAPADPEATVGEAPVVLEAPVATADAVPAVMMRRLPPPAMLRCRPLPEKQQLLSF